MLPQDVSNKVRRQLQKVLFSQSAQLVTVHLEPGEVEVSQAELT
jgi:hypothetical protein